METFEFIKNKLGFGTINKIDLNNSKFVVYQFELKYILVPLLIKHDLFFLTPLPRVRA